MVQTAPVTFSDPKLLAGLYSNASFRNLCKPGEKQNGFVKILQSTLNSDIKGHTLRGILDIGYKELLQNYRHEYLFKTTLLNDYVLKKYSMKSSILLNEFQVGKSIADAVLVNGTNKVFEIKTELDSPNRLTTQIQDYKKAFSEVYLVVHENQAEKYAAVIAEEIGLLCFSEKNRILNYKEATPDINRLDVDVMVKSLRKDELILLATRLSGEIPEATPVKLFKTCQQIVRDYPCTEVQNKYLGIIKKRINPVTNELIKSDQIPSWLKFFCYSENIKEKDYIHLIDSLDITL
ncbi:sce7726 family protein [Algoriphagus sp. Y33]|uniref:sce7726 family protein n=1 Tax=Algoriphagus sp. Y33 TaxID=2772483 RepID=UPI00177B0255|nr:sce7726 family protein [Algoriphagus sp. Y33]